MSYIRNPKERALKNRKDIYKFFQKNICATSRECAEALKLTEGTVSKHVQKIRDGWRPPVKADPHEQ